MYQPGDPTPIPMPALPLPPSNAQAPTDRPVRVQLCLALAALLVQNHRRIPLEAATPLPSLALTLTKTGY